MERRSQATPPKMAQVVKAPTLCRRRSHISDQVSDRDHGPEVKKKNWQSRRTSLSNTEVDYKEELNSKSRKCSCNIEDDHSSKLALNEGDYVKEDFKHETLEPAAGYKNK